MRRSLREYVLSDQNIYMAIYCLNSYIFNYELLEAKDREVANELRDKFNYDLLLGENNGIINKVKKRIEKLLDDPNDFINTKVFFRPKKFDENTQKVIFRPLHTAGIIDQIAIVSMLNIFTYEQPENGLVLELSSLSRLIPGNFYGNRISLKPEELFKPWSEQYKEYSQQATQRFKQYHESKEYTHEVNLDLINFFPTINPVILYDYILNKLPVTIKGDDLVTAKHLLIKLLFCYVVNLSTSQDIQQYYGTNIEISQPHFTLGIPQGLPQAYFFGNICMIMIANIFDQIFEGISLYYVDDSVIFTKGMTEDVFRKKLDIINVQIKDTICYREGNSIAEDFIRVNYEKLVGFLAIVSPTFKIEVHKEGKSTYTEIATASEGEVWLRQISREVSQIGFDLNTIYSDEEDIIVKNRLSVLVNAVEKEKKMIEKRLQEEIDKTKRDELKTYCEKLIRYYKFFSYRKLKLEMKENDDVHEILPDLTAEIENTSQFVEMYKEGIWEIVLSLRIGTCKNADEKSELREYLCGINEKLFGYSNKKTSYIFQANKDFLEGREGQSVIIDKYDTLKKLVSFKLKGYEKKHRKVINDVLSALLKNCSQYNIDSNKDLLPVEFINTIRLVDANTNELRRMLLNARFSKILNIDISDNFVLEKQIRKPLIYSELRLMIFLRNRKFTIDKLIKMDFGLRKKENLLKIDYTILEVLDCFKTFVTDPVKIDFLVRIHQYTCDVWKNGSKYLYFYTLHNQDHAIDLIKNIIKLVKAVSFLQISANDYYLLFIACYLHDISMVKIPSKDIFLLNNNEADSIGINFLEELQEIGKEIEDINTAKKVLEKYHKRVDGFFEKEIRNKHATDSAHEIKTRTDLDFLETCLREMVAQISEGHGQNVEDIYFMRSNAANSLVSLKFDKILLRLADLLDMSSYRVSRPVLNHNIDQMSAESAFHWISHLITDRYELETQYAIEEDGREGYLVPNRITEILILRIYVEFGQLSGIENKKKCSKVCLDEVDSQSIKLTCGKKCESDRCNFLCKWFVCKNFYLIKEMAELKAYLNRTPRSFYNSDIRINLCIEHCEQTCLTPQQFEIIKSKIM